MKQVIGHLWRMLVLLKTGKESRTYPVFPILQGIQIVDVVVFLDRTIPASI